MAELMHTSSEFDFPLRISKPHFPPKFTVEELLSNALKIFHQGGKPPKIPNAFMVYRMVLRKELGENYENNLPDMRDLSAIAAKLWKLEPSYVRSKYQQLVISAKNQFEQIVNAPRSFQIVQEDPSCENFPNNYNNCSAFGGGGGGGNGDNLNDYMVNWKTCKTPLKSTMNKNRSSTKGFNKIVKKTITKDSSTQTEIQSFQHVVPVQNLVNDNNNVINQFIYANPSPNIDGSTRHSFDVIPPYFLYPTNLDMTPSVYRENVENRMLYLEQNMERVIDIPNNPYPSGNFEERLVRLEQLFESFFPSHSSLSLL
ncbi:hypothetical protein G9A89_006520 [Geosiphon pyriformis]|nr:hypothetical protein G9A89_006520 [Geosiphon pyriformis]